MTQAGLPVPPGFVIGAPAYVAFRQQTGLEQRLSDILDSVDVDDMAALQKAADEAKRAVAESEMPGWLADAITEAHGNLVGSDADAPVAVRTSATAEDTASASFAGMGDTFVNMRGRAAVLRAVNRSWQSLFHSRAIYYRGKRGFSKSGMEMAVIVQRQVMSTRSGVMFTIDSATGDRDHVVIEGSFGLGEAVVSGEVSRDRYVVSKSSKAILIRSVRPKELVIEPAPGGGTTQRKLSAEESLRPVLSDDEVMRLLELATVIEYEYGAPQDTEWAFDPDGNAWMVQSRPITTIAAAKTAADTTATIEAPEAAVLLHGLGAAPGSASGAAKLLGSLSDAAKLSAGDVLVTHMTSPDWVPLMRKAAAIVTDSGGMTCHAAIVSRELGIPAVVGTSEATKKLRDGEVVTVDATHGVVVEGALVTAQRAGAAVASSPDGRVVGRSPLVTATKLLVNLSEPSQVERAAALNVDGVGLVRAELMLVEALDGTHPRKLLADGRGDEFVQRMARRSPPYQALRRPRDPPEPRGRRRSPVAASHDATSSASARPPARDAQWSGRTRGAVAGARGSGRRVWREPGPARCAGGRARVGVHLGHGERIEAADRATPSRAAPAASPPSAYLLVPLGTFRVGVRVCHRRHAGATGGGTVAPTARRGRRLLEGVPRRALPERRRGRRCARGGRRDEFVVSRRKARSEKTRGHSAIVLALALGDRAGRKPVRGQQPWSVTRPPRTRRRQDRSCSRAQYRTSRSVARAAADGCR
jgi:phosphohistidine swiveling domain-containing protein